MIEIHFIVNPTSNNGKSNEYFDKIENFLKSSHIKHFVYKTEYKKHAIKLAEVLMKYLMELKILKMFI